MHIGTEKTGSSYLQSMAALNRDILHTNGIWFPKAGKREKDLLNGEVSSGNAQNLTDALNFGNWIEVKHLLLGYIKEASLKNCQSILLSNELMMLALQDRYKWEEFINYLSQFGFEPASYLLILRDPVEQALSLYKHRSKGGNIPNIIDWLPTNYKYGKGLLNFLNATQVLKPEIICRLYEPTSGRLEKIFFQDWLGIKNELSKPVRSVNPSLSLSELFLLKKIYQANKYLTGFFFRKMLEIPKAQKAVEGSIEKYHREIIAEYLSEDFRTWKLCNEILPEGEKLTLPISVEGHENLKFNNVMTFSETQGEVIADLINNALSQSFRRKLLIKKWKEKLLSLIHS